MVYSRVRLATNAASYSAPCATPGAASLAFGVRGYVGETLNGQQSIAADGPGSIEQTQTASGFIVMAYALRNLSAGHSKQRTCRRKIASLDYPTMPARLRVPYGAAGARP